MRAELRGRRAGLGVMLAAAMLVVATWLYHGYRWAIWPQLSILDNVYRLAGEFSNDFYTGLAPPHWAYANFLSWFPTASLEAVLGAIWVLAMLVLWGGFVSICRSLGSSLSGAVAGGLVAVPTMLAGVGATGGFYVATYPSYTAFALGIAGFAALLGSRNVLAGALLGLATLLHPNLGPLLTLAGMPLLLFQPGPKAEKILRFALPWVPLAAPSLIVAFSNQLGGAELSTPERFDLLTIVRGPHHYLYSAFPLREYLQVGVWLGVLVIGLAAIWKQRAARAIALMTVLILGICGLGAAAGEAGGPLLLVSAQTARLTPLITLAGAAVAAAALSRRFPVWGPATLVAIFLLTPLIETALETHGFYMEHGSVSAIEAALILLLLLATLVADRLPGFAVAHEHRWGLPVFGALLLAAAVSLAVEHKSRTDHALKTDTALVDVAREANRVSTSDDVFLTPPELDGFRTYARRGIVVDYGNYPFAKGQDEWVRRMLDVTQEPSVLDPALGTDTAYRARLMGEAYDDAVERSRLPVCKYGVRGVVTRASVTPPPWLRPAYRNASYQLLLTRPSTCAEGRGA